MQRMTVQVPPSRSMATTHDPVVAATTTTTIPVRPPGDDAMTPLLQYDATTPLNNAATVPSTTAVTTTVPTTTTTTTMEVAQALTAMATPVTLSTNVVSTTAVAKAPTLTAAPEAPTSTVAPNKSIPCVTAPVPQAPKQDNANEPHETVTQQDPPTTTTTTTTTTTPRNDTPTATTVTPQKSVLLPWRERDVPRRLSRQARQEHFLGTGKKNGQHCLTHTPTLRQLQSLRFADYIRTVVLQSATVLYENDDESDSDDDDDDDTESDTEADATPLPLAEGMAKVTLPRGFWPTEQRTTGGDRTGRGPAWQPGTPLGDLAIDTPIAQHVRGLAGVYEFSLVDQPGTTLAAFRDKADAYRQSVVGCALDVYQEQEQQQQQQQQQQEPANNVVQTNDNPVPTTESASPLENNNDKAAPAASLAGKDNENTLGNAPEGTSTRTSGRSKATPKSKKNNGEHTKVFPNEEERLAYLESFFWKRLGPTMPPAWYGADHEGTLFPDDDDATGWSLGQLDSCLHVLPHVPGVTSPYLYLGMWASVFCAHSEDMNLLSINYLHAGAPKLWYAIAPGPDAQRFESLCTSCFVGTPSTKNCPEFLRHKRSLLSPKVLQKAGIKYTTAIQRPGDAIITFPAGYHFGFNSGFNVAEATNFGVPEWIPYGWQARVCLCRPDSVRIDMNRLTSLLKEFDKDQSRYRRKVLSWKEWSAKKHAKERQQGKDDEDSHDGQAIGKEKEKARGKGRKAMSEQEKKGEFWIEVAKPVAKKAGRQLLSKKAKSPAQDEETQEETGRGKRKRKLTSKAARWERQQQQRKHAAEEEEEPASKKPSVVVEEIWHLAKPLVPKAVVVGKRVLCLLPGTSMGYAPKNQWRTNNTINERRSRESSDDEDSVIGGGRRQKKVSDDEEEEDEQCFVGQIMEISDNYIRVHIDGLPRTDDVWMHLDDNKVYADGGRWDDDDDENSQDETGRSLPHRHFWQEMDSKRRCV